MTAAACRSCGAEILWVLTAANGKPMPLDATPNPEGNVELVTGRAVVHASSPLFATPGSIYMSHFATCPDADDWHGATRVKQREHPDVQARLDGDTPTLPHQAHSATSHAAAAAAASSAPRDRARVLALIRESGPISDEAIADALALNPSTARPRRVELQRDGLIRESGHKGRTRAGRACNLWESVYDGGHV